MLSVFSAQMGVVQVANHRRGCCSVKLMNGTHGLHSPQNCLHYAQERCPKQSLHWKTSLLVSTISKKTNKMCCHDRWHGRQETAQWALRGQEHMHAGSGSSLCWDLQFVASKQNSMFLLVT